MMRITKRRDVRTTVSIDDELLEKAKLIALREGISMSDLVNRSLRQALLAPATRRQVQSFRMLTYQGTEAPEGDWTPAAIARIRDSDAI